MSSAITTYRSLPILLSYITICATLSLHTCRTIHARYKTRQPRNDWSSSNTTTNPRRNFMVFASLAALSLAATWYYMFAFFAHSYRAWAGSQHSQTQQLLHAAGGSGALSIPTIFKLEMWLRDAKLFREAWETVIESPARFWWSGQIFLWATGWSLFLGVMARRHRIPHVWMYMVVGQIVAISFAQNLFFATILVSRRGLSSHGNGTQRGNDDNYDNDKDDHHVCDWTPPLLLELIPIATSLLSTVLVPSTAHTKHFMLILLIPHLLLFVPAMLRPRRSRSSGGSEGSTARLHGSGSDSVDVDTATKRYVVFFRWIFASSVLVQAVSTVGVVRDVVGTGTRAVDGVASCEAVVRALFRAVYEHPAVSSVSWDVIFCTVGAGTWCLVHGGDLYKMLGGRQSVKAKGEKDE
ncbi:hypothetical protein N7474_008633 [Penicillium riverlandense]|uniref:uncharacterized protein n=1 Tax=Penicillium riverlandense TaxID=1903569 RepID=UPI0025468B37|nr:uncharacterized protein N7474_008633 [Penicillium riverlandense]KAJ5812332.1 hypothetical protein N7474_008633 [Penicillium riverlandense]